MGEKELKSYQRPLVLTHRCAVESQPPRRKDTRKKVNHGDTPSTEKMSLHANACRKFSVLSVSPW